ncbi:MAG: hypothetical protein AAFQ09_05630 [Pseudomonadota bacterium]
MEKPGWNYWPVVILGLLWNLMGCLNYLMQSSAEAVANLPESYQMLITDRPVWATAGFAIAVFGGAVGCIVLLLRRKVAIQILILSLIGTALTLVHAIMVVGLRMDVIMSTGLSLVVAAILLWTAQTAKGRGWLR